MINVMRLARRLGKVEEIVLEIWDKAKVVGYNEKEYAVGMVIQCKMMANMVMILNVI